MVGNDHHDYRRLWGHGAPHVCGDGDRSTLCPVRCPDDRTARSCHCVQLHDVLFPHTSPGKVTPSAEACLCLATGCPTTGNTANPVQVREFVHFCFLWRPNSPESDADEAAVLLPDAGGCNIRTGIPRISLCSRITSSCQKQRTCCCNGHPGKGKDHREAGLCLMPQRVFRSMCMCEGDGRTNLCLSS